MHSQVAGGSCYENTGHIAPGLRQTENRCIVKRRPKMTQLSFPGSSPPCYTIRETSFVYMFCFRTCHIQNGMGSFFFSLKRKETVIYSSIKWTTLIWLHWNSLHKERFMNQARRTPHFARSAKRAWSARGGEEKKRRVLLAWLIKRLLCRLTLDGFEPIALPSFYYIVKSQKSPVSDHGKCHDNDLVVCFISSVCNCKGQLQLKSRNVPYVAWLERRPSFESTLSTTDTSRQASTVLLREITDL